MKTGLTESEYKELKEQFDRLVTLESKQHAIKAWIDFCLKCITSGTTRLSWFPYKLSNGRSFCNVLSVLNFYVRLYGEYGEKEDET